MSKKKDITEEEEYEEEDIEEEDDEEEDEDSDEEEDEEEDDDDDPDDEEEDEDDEEEDEDSDEEEDEEEDDDDDPDDEEEDEGESRPPKGKKKKSKKSDDPPTYTVQRGFTNSKGEEVEEGTEIPLRCRDCVLWKREWLGEVVCHPKQVINEKTGETMSGNKHSCGIMYINKELEPEFKSFAEFNLFVVDTIKKMMVPFRRMLEVSTAVRATAEENGYAAEEVISTSLAWLQGFNHPDQLMHLEKFIRQSAKIMRKEASKSQTVKFVVGDWVSWTDPEYGDLDGIVYKLHKGRIRLAVTDGKHKNSKMEYPYKAWKNTMEPKVSETDEDEDE